jgi:hypothetical protein
LVERDLDRVGRPRVEPGDDFAPEERAVEADLDRRHAEGLAQLGEQIAQERPAGLAVVDVAGAVLDPQQVTGLGEVGGDRVVAVVLAMVGVEAAEGALDLKPGADHRAVGVHREPAQLQRAHRVRHQLGVERQQCSPHRRGAATEPAAQRPITGQHAQPGETRQHRIAGQVAHVLEPARADDQHRQHQPHHRHRRVVTGGVGALQVTAQAGGEVQAAQETPHQLQSAERGEAVGGEPQGQVSVDTGVQVSFSLSHDLWPLGWGGGRLRQSLLTTPRGPFQAIRRLGPRIAPPSSLSGF